ncbi:hypothetical protein QYF36_009126 [Acer negundo]|nr:hypothetical protein QYF36_009126 [Acer negundo]
MMHNFKIYVYPHVYNNNNTSSEEAFAGIFLPHPNPLNPKIGNYLSEHMFKLSLLRSSLITTIPQQAHFFFLPFLINAMRNDRRIRSEAAIAEFVAQHTRRISSQFPFWNASADVSLPQVWPRPLHVPLNPPHDRDRLVYFSGRIQNSNVRQELIALWGNDTSMDVFDRSPYPYEEGFRRSKYCLHVKGYEVNISKVSDAIHYGCIPIILSNYYDLPFANVLDWTKFSVIINIGEILFLKKRLLSITRQMYLTMYHNLCLVQRHFVWHKTHRGYDSFYMTAYQLWLRTSVNRLSY